MSPVKSVISFLTKKKDNSVISSRFCSPHPIDLTIAEREFGNTFRFGVNDVNGDPIFKVREQFRGRRVIFDAARRPIVTLRPNILSAHSRWEVFRGQSTEQKNLIFSVKISLMIEFRTKLDVFLANNVMENVCDYKVKTNWLETSCVVYAGDSSTIVARMYKDVTADGVWIRKRKFVGTVYPNIDHAFIVALMVILAEIMSSKRKLLRL